MPPAQTLRGRHTFYPDGVLFRFQPNKAPLFKGENQRGDFLVISTKRAKANAWRNLESVRLRTKRDFSAAGCALRSK